MIIRGNNRGYISSNNNDNKRELRGSQGMGVVSNDCFDCVLLPTLYHVHTLMLTDVQAPFLGTPLAPLIIITTNVTMIIVAMYYYYVSSLLLIITLYYYLLLLLSLLLLTGGAGALRGSCRAGPRVRGGGERRGAQVHTVIRTARIATQQHFKSVNMYICLCIYLYIYLCITSEISPETEEAHLNWE